MQGVGGQLKDNMKHIGRRSVTPWPYEININCVGRIQGALGELTEEQGYMHKNFDSIKPFVLASQTEKGIIGSGAGNSADTEADVCVFWM